MGFSFYPGLSCLARGGEKEGFLTAKKEVSRS